MKLIIPVKTLAEGKSRLKTVLGPDARRSLNRRFLDHVLAVAVAFPGPQDTAVVTRDREVIHSARARGIATVAESAAGGLNDALAEALAAIDPEGAGDVLILPADLPALTSDDVRAMRIPPIALAADRRGIGTNALFMAAGHRIPFCFGADSLHRHGGEARALGLEPAFVDRRNLALDIDTPDDYRDWINRR